MRVLTAVNLSLWVLLFVEWVAYSERVGFADPIGGQAIAILGVTALLLLCLGGLRLRKRLRT